MIMPRGQPLLLPVNPLFILASLVAALAINMIPLGRVAWMPDMLMLLLAFWGLNQPQRVGMGVAFVLGLCMDVHHASLLGLHALSYTGLVYVAAIVSRRLAWFSTPVQALHMLPIFLLAHALQMGVRLAGGGVVPGWELVLAPVIEAALWPLISSLLLAPQRRAPDADENRPL